MDSSSAQVKPPRGQQGRGLPNACQGAEEKGQPPLPAALSAAALFLPREVQGGAHQRLYLLHRKLGPGVALPPEQLGDAHPQAVRQRDEQRHIGQAQAPLPLAHRLVRHIEPVASSLWVIPFSRRSWATNAPNRSLSISCIWVPPLFPILPRKGGLRQPTSGRVIGAQVSALKI